MYDGAQSAFARERKRVGEEARRPLHFIAAEPHADHPEVAHRKGHASGLERALGAEVACEIADDLHFHRVARRSTVDRAANARERVA